jgi:CheY-like chemotaxis protein
MSWSNLAMNGRILIVDDAMENIQILHHALRDEHDVLFALSGEKALQIAHNQQPDLILLDAVMPGMDGYEVCAALRASAAARDIPVIFVTALTHPEDETRALEAVQCGRGARPRAYPAHHQAPGRRHARTDADRRTDRGRQPAQLQRGDG